MGKSTISMAIFNSFLLVITRGYMGEALFWGMQRLRQVAGMMIPQVLFSVMDKWSTSGT